jgi:hypothetical protein
MWDPVLNQTNAVLNISVKRDALPGNGTVNTFQKATVGAVFPVDECYSSLLGSSQLANELAEWRSRGNINRGVTQQQTKLCFLCVVHVEGL